MSTNSNEFPWMTPEVICAFNAAEHAYRNAPISDAFTNQERQRRLLAAFLREAVFQAFPGYKGMPSSSHSLLEMADNLHTPPSPPPTLDQACKANLNDSVGRAVVRSFLLSLKEKEQS
jgi:hypothetical protein